MTIATRIGEALLDLHRRKVEHGEDWCLHSSWCSDFPLAVKLVRRVPSLKALGKPSVGDLAAVLGVRT